MGQYQTTTKMCHTQEIAFEPLHNEWRPIDEWSEDVMSANSCEASVPANCKLCCRPTDSQVEEVLVVHHEALQKVDFLLRHDELESCESPSVPECVTAVRRARIQKRLAAQQRQANPRLATLPELKVEDSDSDPSDREVAMEGNNNENEEFGDEDVEASDTAVNTRQAAANGAGGWSNQTFPADASSLDGRPYPGEPSAVKHSKSA
eukprot:gnl/TRDRNA2_/TRDRNA2_36225_c0_seq1.p1 gnl/TRDRNA2_/TRDRNA2_36225_c0~~gnl/TRDRNA2_/TRDRNA2_36225_c0_seq1.p1  ORF type:complete len:206 (-),score=44.32 gnl/TRDRNA2_/TRDRNA2_36225_c0_seq1:145-762(-)